MGFGAYSVLLGNGDGTFQSAVSYLLLQPEALTVGDFDGDGKLDFAANQLGEGVWVVLGNGDGTFQTPLWSEPLA
jgi:hypothetical protein